MKYVALGALAFGILTFFVLVVVGWLTPDEALEPPHPKRCDCLKCGRRLADEYVKKYEDTVKREVKLRQTAGKS